RDEAHADRVDGIREHDRYGSGSPLQRPRDDGAGGEKDIGRKRDQFRRMAAIKLWVAATPAEIDAHVAADAPARLLKPLHECRETPLSLRIVCRKVHEHADAAHLLALLRARRAATRQRCRAA